MVLEVPEKEFYTAVLSAGAILTGFCGTFLQFRIQREAGYYRQPALSYEEGRARDVFIGLSHFTSSFLLIILATCLALIFGLVLPLLALAGLASFVTPKLVVAGLLAAAIFVIGYFCAELVHYGILNVRLLNDRREWGRQGALVAVTVGVAALSTVWVLAR
ncbi:hypothetical protein ACFQX4_20800 [Roseomonas sp. GCM10028921]